MPNRNPVKQLFITFPKSGEITKHDFRDSLLRFEPSFYQVVEEHHKDGSPHLHAVIKFKSKYSKPFVIKYFKEKYPNDYKRIDVKPVRSIKHALAYLSKEDQDPLTSGEFVDTRNPQRQFRERFAKELGYSSAEELILEYENEQIKLINLRAQVQDVWIQYVSYESPEYKLLNIYNKFIQGNSIPKDDMTFLLEQLNIKY